MVMPRELVDPRTTQGLTPVAGRSRVGGHTSEPLTRLARPSRTLRAAGRKCWKLRALWLATAESYACLYFKKIYPHNHLGGKNVNWVQLPNCSEITLVYSKSWLNTFTLDVYMTSEFGIRVVYSMKEKQPDTSLFGDRAPPGSNPTDPFVLACTANTALVAKGIQAPTNHLQRVICVEKMLQPITD